MQFLHFSIVFFWCRRVISVSRLDRETSGVLVAATCQEGADALTEQFKEHRVFKRYLALCTGRLEPPEGNGGWCVFSFCGWILIEWNWLDFFMLSSKNIAVSIFNYQTQKYPMFTFWSQHFITPTGREAIQKNLTSAFQGRSVRNSSSLALLKNIEFLGETWEKHRNGLWIPLQGQKILEFYT